jgi:hypothetical protein
MAKLTVNELSGDFTHVLTLSAQDIVNASTNQTIWGQIPAGGAVDVAFAVESVALVGASDITLEVGTGTDDDTLIDSFDIDANAGATVYNTGTDFIQGAGIQQLKQELLLLLVLVVLLQPTLSISSVVQLLTSLLVKLSLVFVYSTQCASLQAN